MMGRTHAAGGMLAACAAVVLLGPAPSPPTLLFALGAGMFGALLPDIDHPQSAMGRQLPIVSDGVSLLMGHRRGVHSLLMAVVLGAAAWFVLCLACPKLSLLLTVSFVLGYLSHLLLDALNPEGVPFLWPFVKRRFGIPLAHTGGMMENWVVFPILMVFLAFLFFKHFSAFGISLSSDIGKVLTLFASPWKTFGKALLAILGVIKDAIVQNPKT